MSKSTKFRPCIDLHDGKVKQIVGGTLKENESDLRTNFVSDKTSSYFAKLYQQHDLRGGHLIKLGPNNDEAAKEALQAWPGGLQVGGGITIENAQFWLDSGADKESGANYNCFLFISTLRLINIFQVIVTSWLFPEKKFSMERLVELSEKIGKDNLVVDISCRKSASGWVVAMNKWQDNTDLWVNKETLEMLSEHCCEFLVHAADVEGLCNGIDEELVKLLGEWVSIPTTYAGGASSILDLDKVHRLSNGKVDITIGSALDIFGGKLVRFDDCVKWNQSH